MKQCAHNCRDDTSPPVPLYSERPLPGGDNVTGAVLHVPTHTGRPVPKSATTTQEKVFARGLARLASSDGMSGVGFLRSAPAGGPILAQILKDSNGRQLDELHPRPSCHARQTG